VYSIRSTGDIALEEMSLERFSILESRPEMVDDRFIPHHYLHKYRSLRWKVDNTSFDFYSSYEIILHTIDAPL